MKDFLPTILALGLAILTSIAVGLVLSILFPNENPRQEVVCNKFETVTYADLETGEVTRTELVCTERK
jgi:hypothetical protein